MARYRKLPVVVEAVQLRWDTWSEMCEFAPIGVDGCRGVIVADDGSWTDGPETGRIGLLIPTLEGEMLAVENDWVIKGAVGEFYPCKPAAFTASFEPVD